MADPHANGSWTDRFPGSWVNGPFIEDGKACCASTKDAETVQANNGDQVENIRMDDIGRRHAVFPVLDVPNLDLYDVHEGDTIKCLGLKVLVLPYKRGLLYCDSIGFSIFDSIHAKKFYSNSLRNSTV